MSTRKKREIRSKGRGGLTRKAKKNAEKKTRKKSHAAVATMACSCAGLTWVITTFFSPFSTRTAGPNLQRPMHLPAALQAPVAPAIAASKASLPVLRHLEPMHTVTRGWRVSGIGGATAT